MMLCGAWRLAYAFALLARALAWQAVWELFRLGVLPASGGAGAVPVSDQCVAAPSCFVAACSSGALGKLIALARRVQAYDAR